jgi:RimJ/RimL family protein N-acetyltransferase
MENDSPKHIIETENLQLIACEPEHFEALLRDRQELGALLNIQVSYSWPVFPESASPHVYAFIKKNLSQIQWGFYLFVHKQDRILIGEGGFKGKPDEEGIVELGYALIPEYRRRGLATQAAHGLARYAFSHPEVRIVQAHTLPDGAESINVLKKLGMKLIGTFHDPEDGDVLRWRVERKDYVP